MGAQEDERMVSSATHTKRLDTKSSQPEPKLRVRVGLSTQVSCGDCHVGVVAEGGCIYMWGAGAKGRCLDVYRSLISLICLHTQIKLCTNVSACLSSIGKESCRQRVLTMRVG